MCSSKPAVFTSGRKTQANSNRCLGLYPDMSVFSPLLYFPQLAADETFPLGPVPTQNCPDGIGSGSTVQQAKTAAASDLLQKVPPRCSYFDTTWELSYIPLIDICTIALDRDDSQAVFEVLLDNFDHVYVHGRSQDWVSKDKLWCFNIYGAFCFMVLFFVCD